MLISSIFLGPFDDFLLLSDNVAILCILPFAKLLKTRRFFVKSFRYRFRKLAKVCEIAEMYFQPHCWFFSNPL